MLRRAVSQKAVLASSVILLLCLAFGFLVLEEMRTPVRTSAVEVETILQRFRDLVNENAAVSELVEYVDAHISQLSAELSTELVLLLEEAQKKYLPNLEERYYAEEVQREFVAGYVNGIEPNNLRLVSDRSLKALLSETKASGYRVETAEGMFWPVIDYELYKKYSLLVSDDLADYIEIMAEESRRAPAKDAALVVGWSEVIKRALAQEEFVRQYPASQKLPEINELFNRYVAFVFYGGNNTPLFDYTSHLMDKDARIAFVQAVKSNPDSELAVALGEFLTTAAKDGFRLTEKVKAQREACVQRLTRQHDIIRTVAEERERAASALVGT